MTLFGSPLFQSLFNHPFFQRPILKPLFRPKQGRSLSRPCKNTKYIFLDHGHCYDDVTEFVERFKDDNDYNDNKDGRDYVHALMSFPLKLGKGEYSKNLYDNDMFHSMGGRLGQLRDSTIDLRSIEFYFTSKGLLWRVDVVFKNPSDYLIIDRIAKHQALNQIFPNVNLHNVARKTDSSYDADYYIGFEMIDYEISLKSIAEHSNKYIEAYEAIK